MIHLSGDEFSAQISRAAVKLAWAYQSQRAANSQLMVRRCSYCAGLPSISTITAVSWSGIASGNQAGLIVADSVAQAVYIIHYGWSALADRNAAPLNAAPLGKGCFRELWHNNHLRWEVAEMLTRGRLADLMRVQPLTLNAYGRSNVHSKVSYAMILQNPRSSEEPLLLT
jgi:hypothetical protein